MTTDGIGPDEPASVADRLRDLIEKIAPLEPETNGWIEPALYSHHYSRREP